MRISRTTFRAIALFCLLAVLPSRAATFTEGFEGTGNGTYKNATWSGDNNFTWNLSDAGIYKDATTAYAGTNSLRLGQTAESSAEMSADKSGGAAKVTYYGRTWSTADGAAVVELQYSRDGGATWTSAGSKTLSTTTYTLLSHTLNVAGNVRVRIVQSSGKRACIDDLTITDYVAPAAITEPANGSTVDFGTNSPNVTKTIPVVVKGSGLTSATAIAIKGSGFSVNTSSVSATKVNSATGATLQVNFKGASGGSYTGTLTLTNGNDVITVGLTAKVSGSAGTTVPVIRYTSPANGSTIDFGTVAASKTSTSTVVVTGPEITGATTVTVSGTGFGANATTLSAAKVSGAGAQLQLTFKSTAAGTFNGTLTLTSAQATSKVSLKAKVATSSEQSSDNVDGEGSTSQGGTTIVVPTPASGNIPANYYAKAEGKNGADLLSTLCTIVSAHTAISYNNLWTAFKDTDLRPDGKIWDMYSTKAFTFGTEQCGNYTTVGSCYNREHSFPKSWFNDATPMYTDLFHVVPTDGFVNNQRSNYPFGECANGTCLTGPNGLRGTGRLGKSTVSGYTGTVWEPDDEYKGDFARSYFYMVAAYNNKVAGWDSPMLAGNAYPAFSSWALPMLLRWHQLDPVSEKEVNRNEAVYAKQKNRNPFIDHPEFADYIWGDLTASSWSASAGVSAQISQPVNGSTVDFGTVATSTTNEKIISVQGASITDAITVQVNGDGFTAEAEWVGKGEAPRRAASATGAAGNTQEYALLRLLLHTTGSEAEYNGSLTITAGPVVSKVTLRAHALEGLPAAPAENVTDRAFTARWVCVGDAFDDGCYTLTVCDAATGEAIEGYPVNVPAEALTHTVGDLDASTDYTYTLASASETSNTVSVRTLDPIPYIALTCEGGTPSLTASAGQHPLEPEQVFMDTDNIEGNVTISVSAPFLVSTDRNSWHTSISIDPLEERIYLSVLADEPGQYISPVRATAGTYVNDALTALATVGETSIDDVTAGEASHDIYAADGNIVIVAPEATSVAIYGVDGNTYANTRVEAGTHRFAVPAGQLYIAVTDRLIRRLTVR